ncbi:SigE family RNA polymerase sigma factor [Nocardioides guangzhouensis]|uniref:SigE family RNA polymerase sigma factor n=1 Tax=Nocardioides guangzhouensis TaxID=2497878 RepID=A0A4Q4Z636_9ACTN|nr:SigE family RNA polymerase sigma factor [Nocardioides guangzhouensis]RYP83260.1 SigE family RNA polymerase sigma factor [Nocardioides guangzhouensis]
MDADDGFDEFVSARWSRLYRTAYLLCAEDPAAAEDLLQGAMEKTFARWPRVSRMEAPEAYVRKLMVNAMISGWRRRGSRLEWLRDVLPERPTPSEETGVIDHALLWPLVCALPERQRAVVVLRYYEDLTERETAEVLGCAVGTVKSQLHDAVGSLRRGLSGARVGEVVER